jgi:hypothetical protein
MEEKLLLVYDSNTNRFRLYKFKGSMYNLFWDIAELFRHGVEVEFVGILEKNKGVTAELVRILRKQLKWTDAIDTLIKIKIPFLQVRLYSYYRVDGWKDVEYIVRIAYTPIYSKLKEEELDYLKNATIRVYVHFDLKKIFIRVNESNITEASKNIYTLDDLAELLLFFR